jgi:hypothetical protein
MILAGNAAAVTSRTTLFCHLAFRCTLTLRNSQCACFHYSYDSCTQLAHRMLLTLTIFQIISLYFLLCHWFNLNSLINPLCLTPLGGMVLAAVTMNVDLCIYCHIRLHCVIIDYLRLERTFPGVRRPGPEADHSTTNNGVKKTWI